MTYSIRIRTAHTLQASCFGAFMRLGVLVACGTLSAAGCSDDSTKSGSTGDAATASDADAAVGCNALACACQLQCENIAKAQCSEDPSVADCVTDCKAPGPPGCDAELLAMTKCLGSISYMKFTCDAVVHTYVLDQGCDDETVAWTDCASK